MRRRLQDERLLKSLIQRHVKYTGSAVAKAMLAKWPSAKSKFVKVFPHEYARALREQAEAKAQAATETPLEVDEAELASGSNAFKALKMLAEKGKFPQPPAPISPQVRCSRVSALVFNSSSIT